MKLRSLSWTVFRLPFRRQFVTAGSAFACREGLILRLETDTGIIGLGEASPLSRGKENSLRNVLAILHSTKTTLIGKQLDELEAGLSWAGEDRCALAAVRCAFDVAICDAKAKAADISVARFLASRTRRSVSVNAIVSASSLVEAGKAARYAQVAGFRCIKLKVGIAHSIDEECARVAAVRAAVGLRMQLRLDANGAWEVQQAIRTIQALEQYDLEFVEQPVAPGNVEGMKRVREAVSTPIAVDEDITDLNAASRVLQLRAAQILVLKPMVIGGLRPARRIAELAQAAGAAVVVTTTLDAGVGAAAALHLAATLPQPNPACGLATGALLVSDLLVHPLTVSEGRMSLPEGPGLGIAVNEAELAYYSDGKREVALPFGD
jgi:o-succinylbenzoate synthase